MTTEELSKIKETVEFFEVKDLRYLPMDNIIVGLVKCPIWGNPKIHEGFVSVQWTKYGKPIKGAKGRKDLILNLV